MNDKSTYLKHDRRLADIIMAIQVMGSYPRYTSRNVEKWNKNLGEPVSANSWEDIVDDHPEFFRKRVEFDDESEEEKTTVSLNWRWSFDRDYAFSLRRILNEEELKNNKKKAKSERMHVTKKPLETAQIETLINTAINLHKSAISHQQQKRWWVPIIVSAVTALVGAIIGFSASIIKLDNNTNPTTPSAIERQQESENR